LEERGVPVVGNPEEYRFGVGVDLLEDTRQGVRFLLEQGRRKIALLGWGGKQTHEPPEWLKITQKVMDEYGIKVQQEWVRYHAHPSLEGAGWEEFREVWGAREEKPDGLFVLDDVLFPDVVMAIQEFGIRVPEQLLVVSLLHKGSGLFSPFPVVWLEHDPDVYAQAMGEMLMKLIRKESAAKPKISLPFQQMILPENREHWKR
jgi:DNA-binding LacI/PurR family transcriptional regulator